jgi:hypothetical protein
MGDEAAVHPPDHPQACARHQELVRAQGGFMTLHSETGFITDPDDDSDLELLRTI